ncbi:hypothetical protein KCV87_26075 [Actinosynnema pretiosum subsp. pretiosum]|uniref:Immunity protein Imm1 n=1 Tax=Actinosynnema pretiosum subsp. pretiosum TaxID=103721 RepID=A0AA45R2S9_9PSEU|nr:hypothetical protein APASM_5924 [Actinosynnema pretiosum subsp. pretiosum]QUF02883.1 hypothetical protein KCV87_26075 [Actinosynnema pretiosum subsp. pretiosum]
MAKALEVYYRPDHGQEPLIVRTPDEVRRLFADWLRDFPTGSVALATVHLVEDPWGAELSVGVDGDKGVLRYSGDEPGGNGHYSRDPESGNTDPAIYYFFTADHEYPPHSEIPVTAVESAVLEFMSTGRRPTCVEWQDPRHS